MQLLDQQVIFTPADTTDCDFALVRRVSELRGLIPPAQSAEFLADRRAEALAHEQARTVDEYVRKYSRVFTRLDSPAPRSLAELQAAAAETAELLRSLRVIADATLMAPVGDAILVAHPAVVHAGAVAHTVLERFARGSDLTELGALAYAAERSTGRPIDEAVVHLNNGRTQRHDASLLAKIAAPRIAHVGALLSEANSRPEPWPWGDEALVACGFCPRCRAAAAQHRDTQLVWGVRRPSRNALKTADITTIDELAAADAPGSIDRFSWSRLHSRASLQQRHMETGEHFAEVHNPAALHSLPEPNPGDIFFDFEGDPLWVEKNRYEWGLEFLFGYIEADTGEYTGLWSTSQAQEKRAFTKFLDYLKARRATYPGMHVYHFGFYETQAMRRLARRHKAGQRDVNEMIDGGLFVDLYETVKAGVHFSGTSYGLKALEPLYMGDQRTGDVTQGEIAVEKFTAGLRAKKQGDANAWEAAQTAIGDYNRYDCLSTWRLRDWLLDQRPAGTDALARELLGGTPLRGDLLLAPLEEPDEDLSAIPLAVPDFDQPGIFYISSGSSTDALGAEHKTHELLGRWGAGSEFATGADVLVVYADPGASPTDATGLLARRAQVLACDWAGDFQRITLRETTPAHDPATTGLSPSYLTTTLPVPPPGPVLKAAKRCRYTVVTGPPGSGKSAAARALADQHGAVLIDDAHSVSLAEAIARIHAEAPEADGSEPVHVVVAGDPACAKPTPPRALPSDLAAGSILTWLESDSGAKIVQRLLLDTSKRFFAPLSTALGVLYPRAIFAEPESSTRVVAEEFTGFHVHRVDHRGNRDSSPEEAAAIARLIDRILDTSPLDASDILVAAGSHNQALLLNSRLEHLVGVRVRAHDQLDGADTAIVIFSLGVSTFADLPSGHGPADVPFAPHILARAFSRAREGAILVCSAHLFEQPLARATHVPPLAPLLGLLATASPRSH